MSSLTDPFQHVEDAQRQGRADHDHQGRQNKHHQRHGHKDRKPRRALFEAHQPFGSHLGRHSSQRSDKWCTEPDRLVERGNNAAQTHNARPLRQILECLIRSAEIRISAAVAANSSATSGLEERRTRRPVRSRGHAEAGFGTNNQQIQRVGYAGFEAHPPPCRQPGEDTSGTRQPKIAAPPRTQI